MADEIVFTVAGDKAVQAEPISLAEAGLKEREHLQEWVLANPTIVGTGVLIVTCEFDRWQSKSGAERDRLDVLGLDDGGHLVLAELKRDAAPDTVEMQAIKYAAMASRFDLDLLADAFVEFQRKTNAVTLTPDEARERLEAHTDYRLNAETLRTPRIVLIAGSFPANLTASVVWLNEMGLDITLVRTQAYQTTGGVIVTVSQHYPPPEVEDFTVAPTRSARKVPAANALPEVDWTEDDYQRAAQILTNATALAALDLCAQHPGEWLPFEDFVALGGRTPAQARGDTGGFTLTVRKQFERSNLPYDTQWAAGGEQQMYYRLGQAQAAMWLNARGTCSSATPAGAAPTSTPQSSPDAAPPEVEHMAGLA